MLRKTVVFVKNVHSKRSFLWGGWHLHSCLVILKQAHADPTLNLDIFTVTLWPLITDIHSKRLSFSVTYHKHTPFCISWLKSDPKHGPAAILARFDKLWFSCRYYFKFGVKFHILLLLLWEKSIKMSQKPAEWWQIKWTFMSLKFIP